MKLSFEKILFTLLIGFIFPLMISLLSISLWFYFDKSENRAILYLISGLLSGLLIDLRFLKRWIIHIYELPIFFVAGIYIFYNILIFGFFMGFPVFNTFLGLLAGYYYGKRICYVKAKEEKYPEILNQTSISKKLILKESILKDSLSQKSISNVSLFRISIFRVSIFHVSIFKLSLFTGSIMIIICFLSGFLAIYKNGASTMIEDILKLRFKVTPAILWIIILSGGSILIFLNIILTEISMKYELKNDISKIKS